MISAVLVNHTNNQQEKLVVTNEDILRLITISSQLGGNETADDSSVPIIKVLYTCVSFNYVSHIIAIAFAAKYRSIFGNSLKSRIFTSALDKFFQQFFG